MGDERRDDVADRRRADVYSSARIGAAAALTIVLVILLVLDVAVPDYDISPGILPPLLGAILALLGLEASALWRGVRRIDRSIGLAHARLDVEGRAIERQRCQARVLYRALWRLAPGRLRLPIVRTRPSVANYPGY